MKNNTRGQMEMSVGTIVTIVLLVTLLILGVVLIKNIFSSAKGVVDLTDTQLRSEINKLFSDDTKVSIYPSTRLVEIKQEERDGVAIGIQNLLTGSLAETTFSYAVTATDVDSLTKCGISKEEAENWITTGGRGSNIQIPSGEISTQRILFEIPSGAPLCTIRYVVNVYYGNGKAYAPSDSFDVTVKAK